MNDKEKLEMIAMCAQALADGKKLQIKTITQGYQDTVLKIRDVVSDIFSCDIEYRIKPEPKTMKFRVYLGVNTGSFDDVPFFYTAFAYVDNYADIIKNRIFVKWITDEITVELPE